MSFATLKRPKERKPYRHILNLFFSGMRSIQVVRSLGLFVIEVRGNDADELCFLQMAHGRWVDEGVDFFDAMIQRINSNSLNRSLTMDELTLDQFKVRPKPF
jgi:hypothetical protein